MPDDSSAPNRGGLYGCFTGITPLGFGGGLCVDQHGNIYPQLAVGTPGLSGSVGAASDLNEYLTGSSLAVSGKRFGGGWNPTSVGGGLAFGSPGASATYGLQPINIHDIPSYVARLPTLLNSDPRTFEGAFVMP
jgi:hypothetical protein